MQEPNPRPLRALVTGGAGFIGSNLVQSLVARGAEVTVLDSLLTGHLVNLNPYPHIRFVRGDVRDPIAVQDAISGCDTVFHLAASVGNKRSIDLPLEDATANVIGTLNVLEACRAHGVRKIVFSSSAGTYGELKTLPIREDHPCEPDSPYGAGKLGAEKMCLAYAKVHGLEAVCLRYFNVYGPNQRFDAYGNVIPIFVHKLLRGEGITIFGDGEQTRDFVHVRDVVQANLRASLAPEVWGAFNVGSGTRVTINHLVSQIGRAMGTAPEVAYAPNRPGDVRDSLADITAAHKAFAYQPRVPFDEGLTEYVNWARLDLASTVAR